MHAEPKTRHQGSLSAEKQLSMHLLSGTERVHVEATPRHRAEANDDLGLQTRNQDARRVAVDLVHDARRHSGRGRRASRNVIVAGIVCAHGPIIGSRGTRTRSGVRVSVFSNPGQLRAATLRP
jgi:hypothetical protein